MLKDFFNLNLDKVDTGNYFQEDGATSNRTPQNFELLRLSF